MKKKAVFSTGAPMAVGTYSQAVILGDLLFVSGQIPLDPATGKMVEGDPHARISRAFENLKIILEDAGSGLDSVVKLTVFLTDLSLFEQVNQVMTELFDKPYPARAVIEVKGLPKGAELEVEAIASVD